MNSFSEKSLRALGDYYVYGLVDPETKQFFYIGKGTGNRVFNHEREKNESKDVHKRKIEKIKSIEGKGYEVTKVILCSNLTEEKAFAAEASLINAFRYLDEKNLANIASGHHSDRAYTVEEYELCFGAEELTEEMIKDYLLVIKINKNFDWNESKKFLYDIVRGIWNASIQRVKTVKYVLGVYKSLIVAVFEPSDWYVVKDHPEMLDGTPHIPNDKNQNRVFFVDKAFEDILKGPDSDKTVQEYFEKNAYYGKTIANLKRNQRAQNPISYISNK